MSSSRRASLQFVRNGTSGLRILSWGKTMVSNGAHAFGLGRSALLAVLLGTLQAAQASAVPIQLTSGLTQTDYGLGFVRAGVALEGPGFALFTNPNATLFGFNPRSLDYWPAGVQPGPVVDFSARVWLPVSDPDSDFATLIYGGLAYWTLGGEISLTTPLVPVDNLVPLPFTLSGWLTAWSGSPTDASFIIDFTGAGTMMAEHCCEFMTVSYVVEPIGSAVPEPTPLLLFGCGLLGLTARRGCRRSPATC